MKNLELKATYANEIALNLVKKLEITYSNILIQKDIYFNVNNGRLKLRSIDDKTFELIWYLRENKENSKYSNYEILEIIDYKKTIQILELSLGVKTIVDKTRNVFLWKDCRIHIDCVANLGEFIEFEIIMIPNRTRLEADQLMQILTDHFAITKNNLVKESYSDLLFNNKL